MRRQTTAHHLALLRVGPRARARRPMRPPLRNHRLGPRSLGQPFLLPLSPRARSRPWRLCSPRSRVAFGPACRWILRVGSGEARAPPVRVRGPRACEGAGTRRSRDAHLITTVAVMDATQTNARAAASLVVRGLHAACGSGSAARPPCPLPRARRAGHPPAAGPRTRARASPALLSSHALGSNARRSACAPRASAPARRAPIAMMSTRTHLPLPNLSLMPIGRFRRCARPLPCRSPLTSLLRGRPARRRSRNTARPAVRRPRAAAASLRLPNRVRCVRSFS
jgi:hypothetical protein